MWAKYRDQESHSISLYLESLVNSEERQGEAAVLIREIFTLSNRLDFQIVRPELLQSSTASDNKASS